MSPMIYLGLDILSHEKLIFPSIKLSKFQVSRVFEGATSTHSGSSSHNTSQKTHGLIPFSQW